MKTEIGFELHGICSILKASEDKMKETLKWKIKQAFEEFPFEEEEKSDFN